VGIRCSEDADAKILLFGGVADVAECQFIAKRIEKRVREGGVTNLSGQLSLLETASAMDYCDVIVTNDSGLMHIAEARQRNLVAVFGSTVRQFGFFPQGRNSLVVENTGLYCRPCSHIGRASCPEGHFRCMNDITVDDVMKRTSQMMGPKV
jgi:heptosyltransferase-2